MITFKSYKRPTLVDMGIDTVREALLNETRSIGRAMKKDLEQVFQTWEEKPKVEMKIHLTRTDPQAGVEVYVDDPIAHMLNVGTKKHYVRPVRAPRMAWQAGFTMKTAPRMLSSVKGGKYGNDWRTSMGHWIKGVKAREWDQALADKWNQPMAERLQKAANAGAAKARLMK